MYLGKKILFWIKGFGEKKCQFLDLYKPLVWHRNPGRGNSEEYRGDLQQTEEGEGDGCSGRLSVPDDGVFDLIEELLKRKSAFLLLALIKKNVY